MSQQRKQILSPAGTWMLMVAVWMLAGCQASRLESQLVGTVAPDFSLQDVQKMDGSPAVALSRVVESGPVVIIFHRGLHCPICTAHLLQISERMDEFKGAGVQVVAIGPDTPAEADVSLETIGTIRFPLLSDAGDKTARAFGLESSLHGLQHGTFVVDRARRIQFAGKSDEPVGTVEQLLKLGKAAGDLR